MKVHHLNCGTMRPPGVPDLVAHVLLCETDRGLVLVDTGFGLHDVADPRRIGPARHLTRPVLDPHETALRQVERLGFTREDVRHVVLTHFDSDHVGGLADFPGARVHLTAAEALGAVHAPTRRERRRFQPPQWAHGPRLVEHGLDGEEWRVFAAARQLTEVDPGVVLVSMPGHTRGHAAVAVDTGEGWVLHAGDAFYHHSVLDGRRGGPPALALMERTIAFDRRQVRANHERLAELHRRGEPDLLIVCSHDPALLP